MILSSAGISITLASAEHNCYDAFEEFGLQYGTHCGVECSVAVPPGKPYHILCHTHEDIDFLSLDIIIDGVSVGVISCSCGEPWIISHTDTGSPFHFPVNQDSGRIEVVVVDVVLAASSSAVEGVIDQTDIDLIGFARCAFNYEATAPSSSKCLVQYEHALEMKTQEDARETCGYAEQSSSETELCNDLSALSASFASFQLSMEEPEIELGVPVSVYETAPTMEWRMRS